ncbi:hypothetical protein GUJ93_ZPchr0006g40927 [Zizania palustris]|uniref:S1-like domain-containing protein n=1 Tax=Zizania palustris TaxID=103762 RepID=A0A8J5VVN1_ZIZPA|nr:hypothetical protein GUJ93_ZPchr0006g40927 [Zizania palustris]
MKTGRKNMRRACEGAVTLAEGEGFMQVLALRGSNLIEVMDSKGVKSLAFFPAKFHKSFWIKKGSFVVVDASGRDQALESGSKIACVVSQVLFHDQVRTMEKSEEWPDIFKSTPKEISEARTHERTTPQIEEEADSDEDDGLPPLEANTNRHRPFEPDTDSDSGSDS